MEYLLIFSFGIVIGAAVVLLINFLLRREASQLAKELIDQTESQKIQDLELLIGRIKDSFGALSLEALSKNTNEFLKLANQSFSQQTQSNAQELEGKKELIDQTLESMKGELQKVNTVITNLEKDREQKFGEVSTQLVNVVNQTERLRETTDHLKPMSARSNSSLFKRTTLFEMSEMSLRLICFTGYNPLIQVAHEQTNGGSIRWAAANKRQHGARTLHRRG